MPNVPRLQKLQRFPWWALIYRTIQASTTDRASLAAAGCAFFVTLAMFPAMSMLISVYGLIFDPVSVSLQLRVMVGLLPEPAYKLIEDRLHLLVTQPSGTLSAGLVVSFLLTFWSSSSGIKAVISAMNVAYDVAEQRSYLRFQLVGLAMTLIATLTVGLCVAVLVLLSPALAAIGLSRHSAALIHLASVIMLIGFFATALGLLYRYGPCRNPPPVGRRIAEGVALATVLWLIASVLVSYYVASIGSFGATYGSIGAVVGVMLWFYVSAYAVVLGAELNAVLEAMAHDGAAGGERASLIGDASEPNHQGSVRHGQLGSRLRH